MVGLIESRIASGKIVRAGCIFAKAKFVNPFFTVLTTFTKKFNPTTLSTRFLRPDTSRDPYSLAGVPNMVAAISSNAVSHHSTSPCLISTRKR